MLDTAKSVQDGSMSLDEFLKNRTKATTASSKFSRVTKTAGSALKSIGATARNMVGGVVIAEVLVWLLKAFMTLSVQKKSQLPKGMKHDKIRGNIYFFNQKVILWNLLVSHLQTIQLILKLQVMR